MSGSKIGGRKASRTNRERYGEDFYKKIGAIGGRNGHTGGFSYNHALAIVAGSKGGSKSRRGLKFLGMKERKYMYEVKRTGETIFLKEGERWHDVQEEED